MMYSMIAVLCLAVIIAANPGERVKRGLGCKMEGKSYEDGQQFTTNISGPCVKYRCKNGAAGPESYECEDKDGKCGYKDGDQVAKKFPGGAIYTCTCHIDESEPVNKIKYSNCH